MVVVLYGLFFVLWFVCVCGFVCVVVVGVGVECWFVVCVDRGGVECVCRGWV